MRAAYRWQDGANGDRPNCERRVRTRLPRRENERLHDQAGTLVDLLHHDSAGSIGRESTTAESFGHVFVCFVLEHLQGDHGSVSPRMVYADSSGPDLVDGFTRKTLTAMIEGTRESAIAAGLIAPERVDVGVQALHRTTEADGVFCCTFFKGVGQKRRPG